MDWPRPIRRSALGAGGEAEPQPVDLRRDEQLAGEPGFPAHVERIVETVDLLLARRRQPIGPLRIDVDVAGGAGACPAAFRLDVEALVADHLHDAPAFDGRKPVLDAVSPGDEEDGSVLARILGDCRGLNSAHRIVSGCQAAGSLAQGRVPAGTSAPPAGW